MFSTSCPYSILLEELRQPMALVFQFIEDPTPCRNSCRFLRQCFEDAVHQEFLRGEKKDVLELTTSFPQTDNKVVVRDMLSSAILLSTPFRTLPIVSLELADLPNLQAINHELMKGSRTLRRVSLVRLPLLTAIGEKFAAHCPNLETCFMSDLPQLKEIFGQMFYKSGLRHLWIENLPQLKTIGSQAVSESPQLRTIRLQNLRSLRRIGSHFASGSAVLERVRLISLPRLEQISSHFAERTALLQIDLEDLPRLRIIESNFAANCDTLTDVTFRDLPELKTIEPAAFQSCLLLGRVYLCNLPLLSDLCNSENPFAFQCPKLLSPNGEVVVGRRKSYTRDIADYPLKRSGEPLSFNFSRVIQWVDGKLTLSAPHLAKKPRNTTDKVDQTRASGLGFNSRRLPGGSLVVEDNIVSTLPPRAHRRAGAVEDAGCGCSLM